MHAVRSSAGGAGSDDSQWPPIKATAAVLELTASEHPELVEFQAHVLRSGTMSFAFRQLAAELGVAPDQLGWTVFQASRDLDRLEAYRGRWRDPAAVLGAPNYAALISVCRARLERVPQLSRQRRLERILGRIDAAYQLTRTRAWIDNFLGPPPAVPPGGGGGSTRPGSCSAPAQG